MDYHKLLSLLQQMPCYNVFVGAGGTIVVTACPFIYLSFNTTCTCYSEVGAIIKKYDYGI
jgi:hypothetical protein